MQVTLIFPPVWDCDNPYPSLPTIGAFLKCHGHTVDMRDLNIEFQDEILSDQWATKVVDNLKVKLSEKRIEGDAKEAALRAIAIYELTNGTITEAKKTLRSKLAEREKFTCAKNILEGARFIASAPFAPAKFTNFNYIATQDVTSMSALLDEIQKVDHNIFYNIFKERVLSELEGNDVIGFSFATKEQLVPGFTMAKLIRERYPEIKIVVGGSMIPYMRRAMIKSSDIFSIIDAAIFGEGETPFVKWLDALEGKISLNDVPNLIYQNTNGQIKETGIYSAENLNELPVPDYSSMPWDRYFFSDPYISYLSSRGCPWNKCNFCSLTSNYGRHYRTRDIQLVVEDLKELQKEYGLRYIQFDDESIEPERLKEISNALLEQDINIHWNCLSRLEGEVDQDTLKLAYQSGLRLITFGLESGSQSVLDLMKKGTSLSNISKVLERCQNAGIWTNTFLMFGFPGETEEMAIESIEFVKGLGNKINSLTSGKFRLEGESRLFKKSDQYGILLDDLNEDDFGPDYPFTYLDGTSHQEVFNRIYKFNYETRMELHSFLHYFGYDSRRFFLDIAILGKDQLQERIQKRRDHFKSMEESKNKIHQDSLIRPIEEIKVQKIHDEDIELRKSSYIIHSQKNGSDLEINYTVAQVVDFIKNEINYQDLILKFAETYDEEPDEVEEVVRHCVFLLVENRLYEIQNKVTAK